MNVKFSKKFVLYKPDPIKKIVEEKNIGYRIPRIITSDECYDICNYIENFKDSFKNSRFEMRDTKFAYMLFSRIYKKIPKTVNNNTLYCISPIITLQKQNKTNTSKHFKPFEFNFVEGYFVKYVGVISLTESDNRFHIYKEANGKIRNFDRIDNFKRSLILFDSEFYTSKQGLSNNEEDYYIYVYMIYKKNNTQLAIEN